MPTTSLESCTSLALVFEERLWFFSNHLPKPRENKKIPDLSLLWFPNHLDTFNPRLSHRALLCNTATVQEGPGTRQMLDMEHPWCKKKKKKELCKGCKEKSTSGGSQQHKLYLCSAWGSVNARFLLVTKVAMQSGQTSRAANACTLIFAVTEVAKQKQTDHFRTWPPYLHLPQPIKLHKKTGQHRKKFEVETWREMKQMRRHWMAKLPPQSGIIR